MNSQPFGYLESKGQHNDLDKSWINTKFHEESKFL